jgi:hypothetical protein
VSNEVDNALEKAKALATRVHMSTQCEQMIESKSAPGKNFIKRVKKIGVV